MKRRDVLKLYAGSAVMGGVAMAATGAAAAATTTAAGAAAAAAIPGDDGYAWSLAGASALVGQQFWLNHPALRAQPLKLARVSKPAKQPDPAMQQFSLVFEGAALLAVAEGTYELQNSRTGTFQLHLVPLGRVKGLSNFRADFNLLLAGAAKA
ncbi:hypothetical protein ASD15_29875 [Massilia sp. Root351]|uniref:DUF6916 family protein n=1 Tax=Massilia sp. Root351 TaxID=1736522 RepID=UPI00070FFB46|nr:hypothetical protein [Massilia sp. Root351]KQV86280.1 hypothetical protein ASD15_29875 [Massilia sp. Root351]